MQKALIRLLIIPTWVIVAVLQIPYWILTGKDVINTFHDWVRFKLKE